jgi:hypothetical protein
MLGRLQMLAVENMLTVFLTGNGATISGDSAAACSMSSSSCARPKLNTARLRTHSMNLLSENCDQLFFLRFGVSP